jgi:hypothetical protein
MCNKQLRGKIMFASLHHCPCDVRGLDLYAFAWMVLVNLGLRIFDGCEHDSNYIFVKFNSIVFDS